MCRLRLKRTKSDEEPRNFSIRQQTVAFTTLLAITKNLLGAFLVVGARLSGCRHLTRHMVHAAMRGSGNDLGLFWNVSTRCTKLQWVGKFKNFDWEGCSA